jgi:hypothetical protein
MLLIFIAYASGRVVSALPALAKPRSVADTNAYLRISRQPLLDVDFWGDKRPLVFPLLLKISDQDIRRASRFQLGFSILAWGCLALMVARFFRKPRLARSHPPHNPSIERLSPDLEEEQAKGGFQRFMADLTLQVPAFALILAFSLDRHIASWDFVMMSESLSISFLALFIALSLWTLDSWQTGRIILLCLAGVLFAFTRDTNAFLLLMVAGILSAAVLLRWTKPRALLLAAVFSLVFLLSSSNADIGERWVFPLGNLIGKRVLIDQPAVSFFEACGMPVSPALMQLSGKFANAEERLLFEGAELADFRSWLLSDGRSCYIRWLISDPISGFGKMFSEFDGLIAFREVEKFFARGYDPLMPVALGKFFYPEQFSLWIWIVCMLAALTAIWRRWWRLNTLWAAFIFLTLLVPPHAFLTWHGDAMAPERHALSVGVQLYLGFWILVLLAADGALSKLYSRSKEQDL